MKGLKSIINKTSHLAGWLYQKFSYKNHCIMNKSSNNNSIHQTPKLLLNESGEVLDFLLAYGFSLECEFDYGFKLKHGGTIINYHELKGVKVHQHGMLRLEFNPMEKNAVQIILALHCFDIISIDSLNEFKEYATAERVNTKKSTALAHYSSSWPLLLSHTGLRNLRAQKTA